MGRRLRNGRAWIEQLIADGMTDEAIVDEVLGRPDGRERPVDVDRELYYDDPPGRRTLLDRVETPVRICGRAAAPAGT